MTAHLGDRLHRHRRYAGLTQRELAQRSGVSVSLIRQLEQGERHSTRLATAHRLARHLGITTTKLIEEHHDTQSAGPGLPAQWARLHHAIDSCSTDAATDPPTVEDVRDGLSGAARSYGAGDYTTLASTLPLLLQDARSLHHLDAPGASELLAQTLTVIGRQLIQTRQYDYAERTLAQALEAAPDRDHHVVAITTQCWLHLRRGRLAESRSLAERWADDIEPRMSRATPQQLAGWGWMLVRAGAAAARDGRKDDAEHTLRAAAAAAAMLPRPVRLNPASHQHFGPALVGTQRVEHAMLQDRPDEALRLAVKLDRSGQRTNANTHRRHLVTKAEAQAHLRKYVDAAATLAGVEADAPQWLACQQSARDVVELIVSRRRTLTPEMRHLAQRMTMT